MNGEDIYESYFLECQPRNGANIRATGSFINYKLHGIVRSS